MVLDDRILTLNLGLLRSAMLRGIHMDTGAPSSTHMSEKKLLKIYASIVQLTLSIFSYCRMFNKVTSFRFMLVGWGGGPLMWESLRDDSQI